MSLATVDLRVDPACPWCWLTALWLFEVERVRPVSVRVALFSLAEVNRAHGDTSDSHSAGERALRVLVAARRAGGDTMLRAVYLELGAAHHGRGEPLGDAATLRVALTGAGLDGALAQQALADESTLTDLLDEHAAAIADGAFGVPTLSVDGSAAFFGPIVDTMITGEDAGSFWDVVAPVMTHPRLFELKRARTTLPGTGSRPQSPAG